MERPSEPLGQYSVFVSYSRQDVAIAKRVQAALAEQEQLLNSR